MDSVGYIEFFSVTTDNEIEEIFNTVDADTTVIVLNEDFSLQNGVIDNNVFMNSCLFDSVLSDTSFEIRNEVRGILESAVNEVEIKNEVQNILENIVNSIVEIEGSNKNVSRGRKRLRFSDNWKQNVRKRARQSCKSYTNVRGEKIESKKWKGVCTGKCRFECSQNFTNKGRKEFFDNFWRLNDSQKKMFYSKTVIKREKKRKRTKSEFSKKKFSFEYYFNVSMQNIRVCKEFYLNTLHISSRRIQWFFEQPNPTLDDKRGKHTKRKVSNDVKRVIKDHINSFPRMPSHYCRSNTSRDYLESNLSISKMYSLYVEHCAGLKISPEKEHYYRTIFNTEFKWVFMCQTKTNVIFVKSKKCQKI